MTYEEQVLSKLWAIVDSMNKNPAPFVKRPGKDFTRNRIISFGDVLRFMITMESGCLNAEICAYFNERTIVPTSSAFIQQRAKILATSFYFLLKQFNMQFPFEVYKNQYHLIGVDGSSFQIATNPDDPTTYHPPRQGAEVGHNLIHTVSLYDLSSRRYLDMVFQPGREKNEYQAFCQMIDRYGYGGLPLFVADRGFASYNVFAHIIERGAFFAIRSKDVNVKRILGWDTLPDTFDQEVDLILSRSQSKKHRLQPQFEERYRYISKNVTFDFFSDQSPEYPIHLRIVRLEITPGIYENLITNLPKEEFSADDLLSLYQLRWGIETSFRDLKHTIGTSNFHSKSPEFIEHEVLARMILYNFSLIIAMSVHLPDNKRKYVYQINLSMAIKLCFQFIRGEIAADKLKSLISRYILPIRPGRAFKRKLKPIPFSGFCYRLA